MPAGEDRGKRHGSGQDRLDRDHIAQRAASMASRPSARARPEQDTHDEGTYGQCRRSDREAARAGDTQSQEHHVAGYRGDEDVVQTEDACRIHDTGEHRQGDKQRR
jgi:hypothetical protein